jgi:hypothetical protein
MIVSKHVVTIYLMQSSNQNLPLSKEEGGNLAFYGGKCAHVQTSYTDPLLSTV